jgi:hypothetical protein
VIQFLYRLKRFSCLVSDLRSCVILVVVAVVGADKGGRVIRHLFIY